MGMMRKTGGRERGEIVQVEGGHIVRATGKKDRHSKVYTSKGPRDRRVRLAAHTAIQFYDVQDRLGYDRPSKAVDWLIKKAKLAIDKLDQLPPFFPTTNLIVDHHDDSTDFDISRLEHHHEQQQHQQSDEFNGTVPHYIPTSLESFFPTNNPSNLSLNFESYPHSGANKPQDLCLSLQSYQDHHNRNSVGHHHDNVHATEQSLFGGGCWDDDNNNQNEINRFSRMMGWSNTNNSNNHNGGGDQEENRNSFLFNHHQMIGSDFRGTLQSSFIAPLRAAWEDNEMPEIDHRNSIAGDRYVPESFSGFCIPSRFHDNEEHDDPSSVSPSSLQ